MVWNYNGAADGTDCGAMRVRLSLDGQRLSPPGGILLRKGPATDAYPFGQAIRLSAPPPSAQATGEQAANLPFRPTSPRAIAAQDSNLFTPPATPIPRGEDPRTSSWMDNMADPQGARVALSGALKRPHICRMLHQGFVTPLLPMGFTLKIEIKDSWDNGGYVGLCGLEVWEAVSGRCTIDAGRFFAVPHSVRDLRGMQVRCEIDLVVGT